MKKILILSLLIYATAQGQTPPSLNLFSAAGQTQIKAYVKYVVDSAFKVQSGVDAKQNSRLTTLELNDTIFFDKRFMAVIGKTVTINTDSIAKYIKVTAAPVDLTSINNSISSLATRVAATETSTTSLGIRITSLEQWRTIIQNDMDATKLYLNKLKGLSLTITLPQ